MNQKIFITGGAGFIGVNAAADALQRGHEVVIFDDLSRRGALVNLRWLQSLGAVTFIRGDVADAAAMSAAVSEHADATVVLHLAGQVAVTGSIRDPRADFEANALGTLNVLEAVRAAGTSPMLIYASTNKVYGGMEQVEIVEDDTRYRYRDFPNGIPETMTLDFHSPYGCSKGAADQYVRDYHRIYGLPTVVFRQSCIYGPRQFGIEDQGWVAWFLIAAMLGERITLYGNGKQVRDLLHVDDLLRAYWLAVERKEEVAGRVFNIGGGPANSLSVWAEFAPLIERLRGAALQRELGDWRQGDQPVYISDISAARVTLGWEPNISPERGIHALHEWIEQNRELITEVLSERALSPAP